MPKPKDYSESAVKLVNPPEVKELLEKLEFEQAKLTQLEVELRESNGELVGKIAGQITEVAGLQLAIRAAIEAHGSYQDLENERYGVQYRSVRLTYDPVAFKRNYPKFADAVIVESVNAEALKGLVKGKLIPEEGLIKNKIAIEHESFAFYVR